VFIGTPFGTDFPYSCSWRVPLFLICFAVPHVPVDVDVIGGSVGINAVVIAAEGFEKGEAFGDAGAIEELVDPSRGHRGTACG
jgi:hypothetical protein